MIDVKEISERVAEYIDKNFEGTLPRRRMFSYLLPAMGRGVGVGSALGVGSAAAQVALSAIDFNQLMKDKAGETFTEMLTRLINESGKDNSTIYNRAHIDRRHFSKIISNKNYQPSKPTVLALAVALELGFDATKKLLASAGFALNKSSLSDVIVSFFIEYEIFNLNLVNQILDKYDQPLLGG